MAASLGIRPWGSARMAAAALWSLVLAPSVVSVAGQSGAPLRGHSITQVAPPETHILATRWYMAGTVIPSSRSIVISPGVPNRMGVLWSRFPILTSKFEVSMTLTFKAPEKRSVTEEGIALWYVQENVREVWENQHNLTLAHLDNQDALVANTWLDTVKEKGFDLLGYRSKFNGLGVFLCDTGTGPAVGAKDGNGETQFTIKPNEALPNALQHNFLDGEKVTIKIRVEPESTRVEIVGKSSVELKTPMKSGGFLGLTTFGGKGNVLDPTERSNFVELHSLEVVNLDVATKGESVPEAPQEKPDLDKITEDVLASSSMFKHHREESNAIKDLTNVVFKLIMESQPMRNDITKTIGMLTARVEAMESAFGKLKRQMDAKTGHHIVQEFDEIKDQLSSMAFATEQRSHAHGKQLESLHEDVTHVHKTAHSGDSIEKHFSTLHEANRQTINTLKNQHQWTFGMSIGAIAFVIVAGLALYNKFRCWEKKHVV